MIDNLHDLTCRGNKDYKEALAKVQDYNMTKILTRNCSIPDETGNYRESKVELNVIYAVQFDIELYNYIDIVLRKLRMGILMQEMIEKQNSRRGDEDAVQQEKKEEAEPDDDDDETKKVDGILAILIGPDGVPLKRNNSDVMNNFFIKSCVLSFTELEKILSQIDPNELRREKRFNEEITKRKEIWTQQTVGQFTESTEKIVSQIRTELGVQDLETKAKRSNSNKTASTNSDDKVKHAASISQAKQHASQQAMRSKT